MIDGSSDSARLGPAAGDEASDATHRRTFKFGVIAARAASGRDWHTLCRKVEDRGYATLVMPDHFGDQFAPMIALASAFEATTTLRAGLLVACNDFRHPVMHAKELATLDILSAGRVDWGIGAGWLASEYETVGMFFDRPSVRVARMQESVSVMKQLFRGGAASHRGEHYTVHEVNGLPTPVQRPHPPLLVGGAGERMLAFAAREADIVGVAPSTTARTFGARPPLETVEAAADRQFRLIKELAGGRFDQLDINMVASPVVITRERDARAAKLTDRLGVSPEEVLRSPHVWLGTVEQICESLVERRERWGVSYWAVPAAVVDRAAPVVERLAGA